MAAVLGWRVERRDGAWFAVKAVESRGGGATGAVWVRHRLWGLGADADREDAEREVARLVRRNVLS